MTQSNSLERPHADELIRRRVARRQTTLSAVVVLIATLPWLGKPLHIDDAADLQYVRQVLREPLDPYGFEVDWDEGPRPAIENYHPPLKYYYQALVLALFPLSEWTLHLAQVPLVALAAWSVVSLGRRFGCPPVVLLALWMLGPGFLPGQNAMLDVPSIALGLAATALLVRGVDDNRIARLVCAGVVLGAALVTKYSALVYLPVWLGYLVAHGRWRHALAPLAALAVFATWCGVSVLKYGEVHARVLFDRVPGHESAWLGVDRVVPALAFLGGAMPAAVIWPIGIGGRRQTWLVVVFAVLAASVAGVLVPPVRRVIDESPDLSIGNRVWWCVLVACGCRVVFHAATVWGRGPTAEPHAAAPADNKCDRDAIFLAWWFAVALVLGAWGSPFLATRRVVEASLPAWILLMRGARPSSGVGRAACATAVLVNTIVGFAVAAADYEFASVYPRFARELSETVRGNSSRVWCHGYWGWSHYTRREGLPHYVIGGDQPQPGSLFVVPNIAAKPADLPDAVRRQRLVHERAMGARIPIRLMSHRAGAGYYSAAWGPLPYAWSWEPLEVFQFFELVGDEN
jgi:hypothetical protein